MATSPMLWIAYDPSVNDHYKNREQFNGQKPAWGESLDDYRPLLQRVAQERDDVLVIEGGMVDVPGPVDFGFDFGFPPGKSYSTRR